VAVHTHGSGEMASVHGMLIFGGGPIYLSHLPMFRAPHDLQLIIEVEFVGAENPQEIYVKDHARSGEKVYTWVPKRFVLSDLLDSSAGPPTMQGKIFRGHFEREGTAITGDVRCVVRRVIHSHRLSAAGPRDSQLQYSVFGSPPKTFAAHRISGAPDFDQVISVELSAPATTADTIVVVEGRENNTDRRVQPGEGVRVTHGAAVDQTMRCLDEIYLELGDLSE
jgi:hypothetical protein